MDVMSRLRDPDGMPSTLTSPPRPGLAPLADRKRACTLRTTDPHETARVVADLLEQLRPDAATLLTEDERAGSPDGYTGHTLHTEAGFSILAVVWRPGQITEIHDHIVWCSFLIMQGAETETLYELDGDRLLEAGTTISPAGSASAAAPPDDIHRVHNTGDEIAITLHVYGADLSDGTSVRRTYAEPLAA